MLDVATITTPRSKSCSKLQPVSQTSERVGHIGHLEFVEA